MRRLTNRRVRVGAWVLLAACWVGPRWAGAETQAEYLAQYVLMTDWVTRAVGYVPRHAEDRALAGVAQAVAETLVKQAEQLTPPRELRDLHPHFLMVLENAERAFHFLAEGQAERAERHLAVVRDESRLIRNLQQEMGIEIPAMLP